MILLAHGAGVGWSAASMTVLGSDENPLQIGKLDMDHISWIASLLSLGGLFGNIMFGFITNRFGRKTPLFFVASLLIVRDYLNGITLCTNVIMTKIFINNLFFAHR